MPIFKFPEKEIQRYRNHGIAHLTIYKKEEAYQKGCIIDLENLVGEQENSVGEQLKFYGYQHTSKGLQISVASEKIEVKQGYLIPIDKNKRLKSLEVIITHTIKLNPIYGK